jgi:hypothetical protein
MVVQIGHKLLVSQAKEVADVGQECGGIYQESA